MRVTTQPDPANQVSITTRCRTVPDFIRMFRRYVDGNSIFIASLGEWPIGVETTFSIRLNDGTAVIRGRCVVRKAWKTVDNPFRVPGLLLGLKSLTARSMQMLERLRGRASEETLKSPEAPAQDAPRRPQITPACLAVSALDSVPASVFEPDVPTLIGPPLSLQGQERTPFNRDAPCRDPAAIEIPQPPRVKSDAEAAPPLPDVDALRSKRQRVITLPLVTAPRPERQTVKIPPLGGPPSPEEPIDQLHRPLGHRPPTHTKANVIPRRLPVAVVEIPALDVAVARPSPEPDNGVVNETMSSATITRPYEAVASQLSSDEVAVAEARGESFSRPTRVATPAPWVTAVSPCKWSADSILPANPLMTLTDTDLAGFVECSLHETRTTSSSKVTQAPRRTGWWIAAAAMTVFAAGIAVARVIAEANTEVDGAITHGVQPAITRVAPLAITRGAELVTDEGRNLLTGATVRIDGISYAIDVVLTPVSGVTKQ